MAEQEEQTPQTDPEAQAQAEDAQAEDAGEAPAGEEATAPEENGDVAEEGAGVVAERAAVDEEVLEADEESRNLRNERVGVVVSDKMEKTIIVRIERSKKHPMYKKYLKRSARKMTHDENGEAGEGDTVRIMETRPISKRKRWRLVDILERAA
ncbi:MAG: 30S ribosomal protein S17 [Bacteroidetes bacterium QH_2_67_10]|nr:MAG: 30S ribosomal protein S17 [Bacteroidetes bacterium QH_2_67_10]PSQ79361.1 MAG: 30S ribosomal protein S17 [Bacteroidetes bacterium QH_8_67_23]